MSMDLKDRRAQFMIGQLVHHKLFGYRGVIIDADPVFSETEEWYEHVARTRPPKDRPWYHILVHETGERTYVAERNLRSDTSHLPIDHPAVHHFFSDFRDARYVPSHEIN